VTQTEEEIKISLDQALSSYRKSLTKCTGKGALREGGKGRIAKELQRTKYEGIAWSTCRLVAMKKTEGWKKGPS